VPENAKSPQRLRSGTRKGLRLVGLTTARGRLPVVALIAKFSARVALGQDVILLTSAARQIAEITELVRHLARGAGVSERTVWRWYERFLQAGYPGLVDRPRGDQGISRAFLKRDAAVAFVLSSFLDGRTVSWIHEQLVPLWAKLYGTASRCPCFDTVRELLRKMLPAHVAKRRRDA
jgi:hypothetical protein